MSDPILKAIQGEIGNQRIPASLNLRQRSGTDAHRSAKHSSRAFAMISAMAALKEGGPTIEYSISTVREEANRL
ncbi:hypothetical protein GGE48_006703 [Rhizobium leguminosarum]|nr:hypothetical protein [Rhizobium leguminosarum]